MQLEWLGTRILQIMTFLLLLFPALRLANYFFASLTKLRSFRASFKGRNHIASIVTFDS
eukprot:m.1684320 g.1684320  ORF g.1684320 m.1684320 type:complete len:59 (+) comp243959_c0_seq1:3-179(+)